MKVIKPLGHRNYGSIPHLPGSRRGPGDHKCHEGQARIATEKARDKNDWILVTEKLDGSNVGVAMLNGGIIPLGRAGYPAISSPYMQHKYFAQWAYKHDELFRAILNEGERIVGEWLMQAHGTRYDLEGLCPFVPFDIMRGSERMPHDAFTSRLYNYLPIAPVIHRGPPIGIDAAMAKLGPNNGYYGAIDPVEGVVWRVERDKPTGKKGEKLRVVDFLVKYVRPDKEDGIYLPEIGPGGSAVWNWSADRI